MLSKLKKLYKGSFLFKILPSPYWWLPHELMEELMGMKSVLDLGCGNGSLLRFSSDPNLYKEGVDIFPEYIEQSKAKKIHDKYKLMDINNLDYAPKSFDAVIALDVLEHLSRDGALKLIKDMGKIARKKIIISTPNGFQVQGTYDENEFQQHKSGWSVKDLKDQGFEVRGLYGLKNLRGERGTVKIRPWWLGEFISAISQKLVYRRPRLSYELFGVKSIADN